MILSDEVRLFKDAFLPGPEGCGKCEPCEPWRKWFFGLSFKKVEFGEKFELLSNTVKYVGSGTMGHGGNEQAQRATGGRPNSTFL